MKTITIKLLNYSHYIFFIIFTIIGLFIYKDYGFNIDETFTRKSGFYWLIYLSDFFGLNELSNIASEKINASESSFEIKSQEAQNYLLSKGIDSNKVVFSNNLTFSGKAFTIALINLPGFNNIPPLVKTPTL